MENFRFIALRSLNTHDKNHASSHHSKKISDYFGSDALDIEDMESLLPGDIFQKLYVATKKSHSITKDIADAVATAVKSWAMHRGATHYTHWFHPLTDTTAEKHDTFFHSLKSVEVLESSALIQQEPDASSFPSGGIRSTFEARGYTAWSPASPFFIWDTTLCIPTVFISYTGDALDYKAPLLKSMQSINSASRRLLKHLNKPTQRVKTSIGWEQEFFLIDRALYKARPDVIMGGRTVFGHAPARGQQLLDHYFGSIPSRVMEFLKDLEEKAYRLGIPLRTRHNEVAPAQYELAPMFEDAHIAADHNQLLRDIMHKIARQHNLKVLFHEKPFDKLNGSGKHCNWSLLTEEGVNLVKPSQRSADHLCFFSFFLIVMRAVQRHADLLRASVATYSNDLRLGGHEAPPAIISVFVGSQLSKIISQIARSKKISTRNHVKELLQLGIDQMPEISKDNTDRNRTSPFAFTGNKFEFRAVGSEANISDAITVLNSIVADEIHTFCDHIEKKEEKSSKKAHDIIYEQLTVYAKEVQQVLFDGDGYGEAWEKEAQKRGLSNTRHTPKALEAYLTPQTMKMFERQSIYSQKEIHARHEIKLEMYNKKLEIEAHLMLDLCMSHIIPATVHYQNALLQHAHHLQQMDLPNPMHNLLKDMNHHLKELFFQTQSMKEDLTRFEKTLSNAKEKAFAYVDNIKNRYFHIIREHVDALELIVDDKYWPLVKYRELLFLR